MSVENILADKVIVVTGAGRGIGRAIALLAAERGAKVVVNDLGVSAQGEVSSESPAGEVVNEIEKKGGEAVVSTSNVADWNGAHEIIKTALENFGRIDAVINNAGILRDAIFHKMKEEEFGAVISVHLKGSFNVSRAAAPHFRQQKSGVFVHMTSTSGLIGNFGQANYAAAKMGIVGLSKSIALDMQRFNVRSNCIAPFAWSRMIATIPTESESEVERVKRLQKMTPDKIAALAIALCSDTASDVTGQIFSVRSNEIFLFSQPRPLRSAHAADGWSPEQILENVLPAFKSSFYPLERSGDVFCWDPF